MLATTRINEYPDYTVTIFNSFRGESVKGLIDNKDLSYSTGTALAGSMIASLEGVKDNMAQAVGLGSLADHVKSVYSTYKGYETSNDTSFPITMHIFPGQLGLPTTFNEIAQILLGFTQPDTENNKFLRSNLYDASSFKRLAKGEDPFKNQLIHVSIGSWFKATGLFCSDQDFNYRIVIDKNRRPLYMVANFVFTPYKLLNPKEMASWHTL